MNPLQVIILCAFPGVGKSTLAKSLGGLVCSADETQRENARSKGLDYDNGGEGFDGSLVPKSHPICFRKFSDALLASTPLVIVDNTNLSASEIAPYVLAAQAYGYDYRVIRLDVNPEAAFARQVHGVPYAVIRDSATGKVRKTYTFGDDNLNLGESIVGGFCTMVEQFNERDVMPWWSVETRTDDGSGIAVDPQFGYPVHLDA